MRYHIQRTAAYSAFAFTLLFTALFVTPMLSTNPTETAVHRIVFSITGQPASAARGTKINVAPINNFFNGAYNAIRNIGAPIAILAAAFAGILILMGHRGGVEKLLYIAIGIIIILFAPTIIRSFF